MIGFEQTGAPESGLSWRTFGIAFAVHVALFLFFWGMGIINFRKPDVIIPIDMTIVPPWAQQTDDPNPDPNPPPPQVKEVKPLPKAPEPKNEEVKPKVDAVEKVVEKKKVERGELKNKAKLQKTPPKPQKPEPKLKDTAKLNKVPAPPAPPPPPDIKIPDSVRDFGKGTASEDPLKNIDMKKMLEQGYRYGARNQLATSEEQLCLSLIKRAINREWDKESFNYHEGLRNIQVKLQLGIDGKVRGFMVLSGSGDADVDRTAHNALTRLRGTKINGLTEQFLTKYPELNTVMEPKMGH